MNKKKILLASAAFVAVVAGIVGMSAFEAHVINVTAKIENALSVSTDMIDFGTVFPQEQLDKKFTIALSQSFLEEGRVDDVDYIIRQKPKCGVTNEDGTVLIGPTWTGHVVPAVNSNSEEYVIDCEIDKPDLGNNFNGTYGVLPSLCEYLSKHSEYTEDTSLDAFHKPWTIVDGKVVWNEAKGHLSKIAQRISAIWTLDLKVPCFGDYCAQDWEEFVEGINPDALPANQWVQPIANEHKIFGCNLWIEVTDVSLANGRICEEKVDVMLVLDRSGSIGDAATDMKDAAKAFVDALLPLNSSDGAIMGLASFGGISSLDYQLTDDDAALKTAIDGLVISGATNLVQGINEGQNELVSVRDRADAPNFMVLVTDGIPNRCADGSSCGETNAKTEAFNAATNAKAAGTTIFVLGVGAGVDDVYLKTLASSDSHYFNVANFEDLEAALEALIDCPE